MGSNWTSSHIAMLTCILLPANVACDAEFAWYMVVHHAAFAYYVIRVHILGELTMSPAPGEAFAESELNAPNSHEGNV